MTHVLLAEDSATQAAVMRIQLQFANFDVQVVSNGRCALEALKTAVPDLVVTDLHMPELDGVQLIEAIRREHPTLPVVFTSTHGSEDMALQALKSGALSFVPKAALERHLGPTLRGVLEIARTEHDEQRLRQLLVRDETGFWLPNDPALIPPLVAYCKHELALRALGDQTGVLQIAVALTEALRSAIYEGNLKIGAGFREQDPASGEQLAQARRREPPFQDRRVHVTANVSLAKAVFVVRHEGPAVFPAGQPSFDLDSSRGRGALLMQTFFDEVQFDASGRARTLVKRRTFT